MSKKKGITYQEHQKDMAEFKPYIDLMTNAEEHETTVKQLYNLSYPTYLSNEFEQAYYNEIRDQLNWFKENTTIKQSEEKVTTIIKSHKYLEYNDE